MVRRSLIVVMTALLALLMGVGAASAQESAKPLRVLVINSWDQNLPWSREFMAGFESAQEASGQPAQLYVEYLDSGRFSSGRDIEEFLSFLEAKYGTAGLDYVVAESLPAVTALDSDPGFLPGVDRIAVASGGAQATTADATVPVIADYGASVEELVRLQDPSLLVVVADTKSPGGQQRLDGFTAALESSAPDLPVRFNVNESVSSVASSLAQLPDDAAVYYLLVFQDADGAPVSSFTTLEQLSAASSAPVYSNWEILLGHGIVGGYMISAQLVGEQTWDTMLALRAGQPVPELEADDTYRNAYDWRELVRFGLSDEPLPPGSEVLFYRPTFWEQYWPVIIITSLVVILLAVLSVLLGISNRRLNRQQDTLEAAVAERTSELAHANEELEQFAYVTSHDLRAPLRTISGFSTILRHDLEGLDLDEDVQGSLDEITGGVARMQALITALLDYSRLGGEYEPQVQAVEQTVLAALQLVQADLDAADARVGIDIPDGLTWRVEEALITSGLVNIIENSIKYRSSERPLRIRISAEQVGDRISLTIADNGSGIAPDQIRRATKMFQRLTTEHDGLGIGLASVQRIVAHNGGTLDLDSDGHTYTTVAMVIPVAGVRS